jgi:hypothetical protein
MKTVKPAFKYLTLPDELELEFEKAICTDLLL